MTSDDFDLVRSLRLLEEQDARRTPEEVRHDEEEGRRLYRQYERWLEQEDQRATTSP